jgi:hypothetical protein
LYTLINTRTINLYWIKELLSDVSVLGLFAISSEVAVKNSILCVLKSRLITHRAGHRCSMMMSDTPICYYFKVELF